MAHDQLFKELLQAFLREFKELFYPQIAARLDWEQMTFPNTELFTDVPEGSVRRADTVALVPTLDGDEETEVGEMLSVYEERGMVKGMRNTLLDQMREKFGVVPEQAEIRVRSITDEAQLTMLLRRVLTAETLADMKLEEV